MADATTLPSVLRLFRACCSADDAFAVALASTACHEALHEQHPLLQRTVRFLTPLSSCAVSNCRLTWARASGLRVSPMDCLVCAARVGALDVCKSLLDELPGQRVATSDENGARRAPAEVCRAAATGGHVHVIEWARSIGCAWDASCCAAAAFVGDLACLQWLRAHGCAWDKMCTARAAVEGHAHVLQWARDNGCDYSEDTTLRLRLTAMTMATHPWGPGRTPEGEAAWAIQKMQRAHAPQGSHPAAPGRLHSSEEAAGEGSGAGSALSVDEDGVAMVQRHAPCPPPPEVLARRWIEEATAAGTAGAR